jgi:hypothetical protein
MITERGLYVVDLWRGFPVLELCVPLLLTGNRDRRIAVRARKEGAKDKLKRIL